MSNQTKYTPGALRAGKNIADRFRVALPNLPESNAETLAAIIDAETAVPELLAALKETARSLKGHLVDESVSKRCSVYELCPCWQNELARAEAAIAKAEGK